MVLVLAEACLLLFLFQNPFSPFNVGNRKESVSAKSSKYGVWGTGRVLSGQGHLHLNGTIGIASVFISDSNCDKSLGFGLTAQLSALQKCTLNGSLLFFLWISFNPHKSGENVINYSLWFHLIRTSCTVHKSESCSPILMLKHTG